MEKTTQEVLSVRIPPKLKDKFIKKANELGIPLTEAVIPVLRQIDIFYNREYDIKSLISENIKLKTEVDSLKKRIIIQRKMLKKLKIIEYV